MAEQHDISTSTFFQFSDLFGFQVGRDTDMDGHKEFGTNAQNAQGGIKNATSQSRRDARWASRLRGPENWRRMASAPSVRLKTD